MNENEVRPIVADTEEVRKAVMLVRPTVASVSEVGKMLLMATKNAGVRTYGDEASSYLETLENLILNWMAEGKHKELHELASAVRRLLSESTANPDFLTALPTHDQLTVRLDVLVGQVARLLMGDSMAKYMGVLAGSRRDKWRALLLRLYEHGDGPPVRKAQIVEFTPDGMNAEAALKAVDSMAELGLLVKHRIGPKNVQIGLTWAGRRVAQTWVAIDENTEINGPKGSTAEIGQDAAMRQSERMLSGDGPLPGGMKPFDEKVLETFSATIKGA